MYSQCMINYSIIQTDKFSARKYYLMSDFEIEEDMHQP